MLHCRLKELLDLALALALALISPILLNALLLESSLGIIVSGGLSSLSVELLLGDGSSCWLPFLPAQRSRHSQSGLVICGGGSEAATLASCITLEAGVWSQQWTSSHSLQQQRWGHLSWETEGGIILLGGTDTGARRTTELLTSTSSSTTEQYRLSYDTRYTMHKFIIRNI